MRGLAALLVLSSVTPAAAEDAALPLVRARVERAAPIMVGEPAHLVVEVLTPTWFLEPPRFPTLDVPDAFVLFQERGINLNESIGGTSYSGLQREYLVTPMREGRFEIPPFEVTVVYAIDAKPSKPTALTTKPLSFEATIPTAAQGLAYFVSATRLDLDQALDPKPKDLVVGGALKRTVTVEAEGAFGMMLPPLVVPAIDGLSAYADPPQVEDRAGEREKARVARRVESVTYRFEREGKYELPAIEIAWWDVHAKRMRQASLPVVVFSVASAPARADEIPLPDDAKALAAAPRKPRASTWPTLVRRALPALVALAVLGWASPLLVRRVQRIRGGLAEARRRRLDSEPAWFARVRRAAAKDDAQATYHALLGWAQRRGREGGRTLDAVVAAAGDAELAAEIDRLGDSLYGGARAGAAWSAGRLVERLALARRGGRRSSVPVKASLGPLNPLTRQ